jgi:hypothetical protein
MCSGLQYNPRMFVFTVSSTASTIFLLKKLPECSDPKFGQRGVVLVIPVPGKKGPECHSG